MRELGRVILRFADAETAALWAPELQVQVATLAPHGGPAVDAGPVGKRTSWPSVTQPERRPGPPGPFAWWRLKHLWVSLVLAGLVGAALVLAAAPSTGRLPLAPPARGDEHAIAADRPPAGGRSLSAGSQAVPADIGETPTLPTQKGQQSLPVADPPVPAVPPTGDGRAASTGGPSAGSAQPSRGPHPADAAPSDEHGGTTPSAAKSEPTAVTTGPEAKRLKRLHSKRRVRFGNNRAPILE